MTRAAFSALAAAAFMAGCASTPESTVAGCRVASAEGPHVTSYGRARPQSEMDQRFARADLARSGYRQAHMDDKPSATEDALRSCLPNG